jgi:hypothetical protein
MSRRFISGVVAAGAAICVALSIAVAASATAAGGGVPLGPVTQTSQPTYLGYYDGHKDTFLATDTSNKAQAAAMHINYSKELASVKGAPRQFFIEGKAAPGQISVFGSEPGEDDYNPLWEEIAVTWKAGVTPVTLKKDDQIDALAKAGKLTEKDLHIVFNAPITKVGK